MANTILMKSRQDDATGPGATALKVGELAVNTFDGRIYLGTDLSGSAGTAAGGTASASTNVGAPILDEDNFSSNSATSLATQQSIKAYIDSNAGTGDITGVTAGDGLSGGGSSGGVSLALDLNELGTETSIAQADFIAMVDATDNGSEKITFSNLEDTIFGNVSGDATVAAGGALTIASSAVEGSMLNNNIVSGLNDINAAIASTDEMIISDAGTIKRTDVSRLGTFLAGNGLAVSSGVLAVGVDDSSVEIDSDAIRVKASGVTNAMLAGSIANAKLSNSAITVGGTATSLGGTVTGAHIAAALNSDLGGNFTIGNQSSDTATFSGGVTVTGDLTVSGSTTTVQNVAIGAADAIVFEGATANDHETTLTLTDPTGDRTITLPDTTGTVVTTGDSGTVTATMLAANSVDSSELVDGSIDASHIATGAVTHVKLAADAVEEDNIADNAVESEHINNNVISGQTDIGAAIAATDELLISDAGTIKRTDVSRIGTFLAGDGLAVSSGVLAVGVDDSSVEINSDALRVKASGITNAMLAGSIANAKLANDGITIAGADTSLGGTITAATIAAAIDSETMTLTNTTISGGAYST